MLLLDDYGWADRSATDKNVANMLKYCNNKNQFITKLKCLPFLRFYRAAWNATRS